MKRLINPFLYIAGGKALLWGTAVIAIEIAWLFTIGFIQDSYLHFSPDPSEHVLLKIAAMQLAMWLIPALLAGLFGLLLSRSKIRLIDILGTTALAQAPLLLLLLPLSIGSLNHTLMVTADAVRNGMLPQELPATLLIVYGFWSLAALILFFIRNYQALSVSCNLSGWRSIAPYIAVVLIVTWLSQYLRALLF